jgi:transglutaminase-like putative cysteine protease
MLAPHTVRLRPRCDVTQKLLEFAIEVDPVPSRLSENVDLDGNAILKLWFADEAIESLKLTTTSTVETYRSNPFDFLLESWATRLPIDYPIALYQQLQPYLGGQFTNAGGAIDPIATQLAQEIWHDAQGNTISFLTKLNQQINETCDYKLRETGDALPAGITWTQKAGSCRDFAVLFMETCRAVGLASRFVSGYQEGDPDSENRDLHAWAEVYLPGAGWRGFDPTQGLAVGDRHITLVTSPFSRQTAPITGSLKLGAGVKSDMSFHLTIKVLDD